MHKHCRGCVHHNRGREGTRYEDWCCQYGDVATKKVGHCRLHQGRKLREVHA